MRQEEWLAVAAVVGFSHVVEDEADLFELDGVSGRDDFVGLPVVTVDCLAKPVPVFINPVVIIVPLSGMSSGSR